MIQLDDASRRQVDAADPARSTWLSANAGSGKTRVLTDRVARLLLNGVPPQNILCLTYTKAAAGEMQNRLFKRLGEWAMKDDIRLSEQLERIGVPGGIDAERLAKARRLFALAIETPGGLKIQTIHAFCAAILRQFPLEAGVSPRFREVDERESKVILRTLFDRIAEGPHAATLAEFARYCTPSGFQDLLEEIVGMGEAFETPRTEEEILDWYGFVPGETPQTIRARVFAEIGALPGLVRAMSGASKTLQTRAATLKGIEDKDDAAQLDLMATAFLTADGRIHHLVAKLLPKHPEIEVQAGALLEELVIANARLTLLGEARRTLALHRFARLYVTAYTQYKAAHGLLDFDDLIRRTRALLENPAVAQWVLFRLDGGIDHILVDEAQDTSPAQWAIIKRLAEEFTSGAGARANVPRTLFVVGDRKQSIYSFQGAAPEEFTSNKDRFKQQLSEVGETLQDMELQHSFRSSPLVLGLVDRVFTGDSTTGVAEPTDHAAFFDRMPGRIDLWPLLGKAEDEDLPPWHDPAPRTQAREAVLDLADRIAAEAKRMVQEELVPGEDGDMRPMEAGDILILVRRRSFITNPLILALKREGLEVAGSDQIVLASELAVMDIVSVLKVLLTPADSLSLAEALRSPLFGLSEGDLFRLSRSRTKHETLLEALERNEAHGAALGILTDLRAQADYLRPFELIERLLIRHGGRKRLLARLGEEVGEALDVLLAQALAYEATEVPSLTGFLTWHEAEGVRIKRQSEGAGDKIRVMTVHGAKGLESEVVILPDTADYAPPMRDRIIRLTDAGGAPPVFRAAAARRPVSFEPSYEAEKLRLQEESNRLLYVALTRAKSWLIVCGAGKDAAKDDRTPCWHRLVAQGMASLDPQPAMVQGEEIQRLQSGPWPVPSAPRPLPRTVHAAPALPAWADTPAPPGPPLPRYVSPSGLGLMTHAGATDPSDDDAMRRGTMLHLLLEHLPNHPPEARSEAAAALLRESEDPATDAESAELLAEAEAVLAAPDLAPLFGEGSLAEVDITAQLPELKDNRLSGRIDRLVRSHGHILAVDFKSNRAVPAGTAEIPEGILMQLGAYAAALQRIFPGDAVEVAILWTATAQLMRISNEIVADALTRATIS